MTMEHTTPTSRYEPAMPLAELFESKNNPRKRFDPEGLKELEQSIREKGVLTPLLVRPNGKGHEIAAGHRRYRAAKAAGLSTVPARVLEMSDVEFLEVLVIENDQREDVHPLEEADGYRRLLMPGTGYDVARVAARVGRSVKYVYDRLKLLTLVPKAQDLFLDGKFSAGHAILLARLTPKEQERAIEAEDNANAYRIGGLFTIEHSELPFEWKTEDGARKAKKDPYGELKAVSVREFQTWIQDEVRAEPATLDGFLFPETAATLEAAKDAKLKAILITRDYMAREPVRRAGPERVFGSPAWKRADGKERSKPCDWSRVGFVACGPGQGEAFMVCVNKDKCTTHWADRVRARQRREKAGAQAKAKGEDPRKAERDTWQEQQKRDREAHAKRLAAKARWEKAAPAILAAIADKVKRSAATARGPLADLVVRELEDQGLVASALAARHVPRGNDACDFLRHVAFAILQSQVDGAYDPESELPALLKPFGIDALKILDEAAPAPAVQTSAKPARGTCRKCGCTEDAACAGGCGWVDKDETKCSSCFPVQDKKARPKKAAKKKGSR